MSVFILKRGPVRVLSIPVTITGTGNASYCYAMIGGAQYTAAATGVEVMAGDVITFGVYAYSSVLPGTVTIDGTKVLSATNGGTATYEWTIPDGISTITIRLAVGQRNMGTITVTTT